MDCAVCGIRSSMGYCVECQALLCEECAVKCETCSKLVCPEHVHETRSGRRLCNACYADRKAKREQRKAGAAPEAALPEEEQIAIEEGALTASSRRGPDPWQWSLGVAVCALIVVAVLIVWTGGRRIPLGGSAYVPTPIIPILLAVFSGVWAFFGFTKEDYYEDRGKCVVGPVIGLLVVALSIFAIVSDPARTAELEARMKEEQRQQMTDEELAEWREQQKERYSAPQR